MGDVFSGIGDAVSGVFGGGKNDQPDMSGLNYYGGQMGQIGIQQYYDQKALQDKALAYYDQDRARNIALQEELLTPWRAQQKQLEPIRADIMTGLNKPAAETDVFQSMRGNIARNYDQASEQILSKLPQGGMLQAGLAENERGRAGSLTDALGQIEQNQNAQKFQLATGMTPAQMIGTAGNIPYIGESGLGGIQSAMQAQGMGIGLQQQANASQQQKKGDLGMGLGYLSAGLF